MSGCVGRWIVRIYLSRQRERLWLSNSKWLNVERSGTHSYYFAARKWSLTQRIRAVVIWKKVYSPTHACSRHWMDKCFDRFIPKVKQPGTLFIWACIGLTTSLGVILQSKFEFRYSSSYAVILCNYSCLAAVSHLAAVTAFTGRNVSANVVTYGLPVFTVH